ncbi:MAG: apolipoprotein N-acyltransferase, partial [Acidothermales bacterium]|nr:apolipoprotein N-acyltransferase [Acidothermales bacterium]
LAVGPLLGLVEPPPPDGRRVDIAAVQGNDIESSVAAGVTRESTQRIVDVASAMLDATRPLAKDPPEVVVWPENSLDADPREDPVLADRVRRTQRLLGDGTALLAGTSLAGPRPATFYNAVVEFGPGATIADAYRKRRLVPFGEYVPWRALLGGFPPLRVITTDGVPGPGPRVLEAGGARIGPVTCYENVFPGLVRDQVRAGAEVLVVSTNNASYGRTAMSRQHLAFSQVRAVETGRWVLHAGISGISGVVDPYGDVSQRTELFSEAVVRAELPLVTAPTPYVRAGNVVAVAALAAGAGIALWPLVDRRSRGRRRR